MDDAATQADELIAAEVARQDRMWGAENERADISNRQLHLAALAQLDFLELRESGRTNEEALHMAKGFFFPDDWGGFRDYGSAVANLVVAAAYIRQEIARRVRAGESTHRTSRNVETQPYNENCKPSVIEP